MTWKTHIDKVTQTLSKSIGILYNARGYLHKSELKQLYFAFVQSHLNYCNIVWGSTYKSNLKQLHRQQKHVVRVINNKPRLEPSEPLFKNDGILNIYSLNICQVLCTMFKCKTGQAPNVFRQVFAVKCKSKYTLRSENELHIPFSKTKQRDFSFSIRGPTLWNKIVSKHQVIENIERFSQFKATLRKILLFKEANIMDVFFNPLIF